MKTVQIRAVLGSSSASDLTAEVQDATFDYLKSSDAPQIRVSSFLTQDWAMVESEYAELAIEDECPFISKIEKIIPGSKTRKDLKLPCEMKAGEQLTVIVARSKR
jgi:hypothetical protein